jgi:SAM-dependent methyltransferase
MLDVLAGELEPAPSAAGPAPRSGGNALHAGVTEPGTERPPSRPDLTVVHAPAEATGLPPSSFDLVVLADALQWIDPEAGAREAARLLAPRGVLAVVDPRPADTPFMRALGERIAAANFKARPRPLPIDLFFSVAGAPAPARERFDDEVELDDSRLEAVLRSISYVGPAIGPEAFDALLRDARRIAGEQGGARWARVVTLTWGRAPG